MVLAREEWLALEHLCKDTSRAPDVHFHIVLLPGEHDLGGAVVARGDVAGHLGVLDAGETKVANLELAVCIDEEVAGLEVTVKHVRRVDILQTT